MLQACHVAIKSHRPMEHLRMGLLESTLRSARAAFPSAAITLFMNDGGDGSAEPARDVAEEVLVDGTLTRDPHRFFVDLTGRLEGYTPGHGAQAILRWALQQSWRPSDVLVTSDDDMLWHPGAEERLRAIWRDGETPRNLVLVGGLLEPVWDHNTPRGSIALGGENVLLRDSVPGASWSLPMFHAAWLLDHVQGRFGFDSAACQAIQKMGGIMAAVDLCEHAGEDATTHDNRPTRDLRGKPIDKQHWGLT